MQMLPKEDVLEEPSDGFGIVAMHQVWIVFELNRQF